MDKNKDFINTATFGAVDNANGVYYTLMQPPGTAGIHLAAISFAAQVHISYMPLPTTICFGAFTTSNTIVGIDENVGGPYFAIIDPATGKATAKTMMNGIAGGECTLHTAQVSLCGKEHETVHAHRSGSARESAPEKEGEGARAREGEGEGEGERKRESARQSETARHTERHTSLACSPLCLRGIPTCAGNYSMGGGDVATYDAQSNTLYAAMAPAHGGNTFKLFGFDCKTGALIGDPVVMSPTPDTQGPSGLMAYRPNGGKGKLRIFALMPPVGGAWELVIIDPASGSITSLSAADKGIPSSHLLISGASYILPKGAHMAALAVGTRAGKNNSTDARLSAGSAPGDVLYTALASEPGLPPSMYGIDLECALGNTPAANCTVSTLPWPGKSPEDLGLYLPPTTI